MERLLLVYVDDILLTGNDELLLNKLTSDLNRKFALKNLGQIRYFLGIEAYRDTTGLYLSQSKYVTDLLKKHSMENMKPCSTPMTIGKLPSKRKGTNGKPYSLQKCNWCLTIPNFDQARHL